MTQDDTPTTTTPRAGREFWETVTQSLAKLERRQGTDRTAADAIGRVLAGTLDDIGDKLDALAADHDVEARAFAGMVVTRRVVLNLRSGSAVAGLVVRHDGPLLEVADAVLLQDGAEPRPVDGRLVIERVAVEFIQVLT